MLLDVVPLISTGLTMKQHYVTFLQIKKTLPTQRTPKLYQRGCDMQLRYGNDIFNESALGTYE